MLAKAGSLTNINIFIVSSSLPCGPSIFQLKSWNAKVNALLSTQFKAGSGNTDDHVVELNEVYVLTAHQH